jgi:glycosyltransferase involved in cell wall biosynthesis
MSLASKVTATVERHPAAEGTRALHPQLPEPPEAVPNAVQLPQPERLPDARPDQLPQPDPRQTDPRRSETTSLVPQAAAVAALPAVSGVPELPTLRGRWGPRLDRAPVANPPSVLTPPRAAGRIPLLLVITTTDFGGTENFVEHLVSGLDRGRFAPIVCSLCPPGRAGQRIAGAGIPVETLGMAGRPRPPQLVAGAWRLARLIDRRQVALVHALLYRANVVAAAACRLVRRRPVLVWGQHSQIATSEGWLAATAARWTRPLADRIVAVAEAVKDSLAETERIPRERIAVIGNGVDAERFKPAMPAGNGGGGTGTAAGRALRARLGLDPQALVVGAVGRLAPEKGLSFLIEALAALRRARNLPLALVLVGDGPERPILERQVERLRLSDQIRFLGFQRQLETIYPAFDVLAMPSLEEASPMALLEAMACGCPVVASAVGGVPEILAQGRCGLLVEPAAPPALARSLAQLAANPALRHRLATEARARILAAYDLPAMIRRHEELYLSLLAQGSRR